MRCSTGWIESFHNELSSNYSDIHVSGADREEWGYPRQKTKQRKKRKRKKRKKTKKLQKSKERYKDRKGVIMGRGYMQCQNLF